MTLIHKNEELTMLELTGNVVLEKDHSLDAVLKIACPKCFAPKGQFCDPGTNRVCAERMVKQFVTEAKPLTGDSMV